MDATEMNIYAYVEAAFLTGESDADVVEHFVRTPLDAYDAQHEFVIAMYFGYPLTALYLLQTYNVDPNVIVQPTQNNTALHVAVQSNMGVELVDALLRHGADANAVNLMRQTPMHLAALYMTDNNVDVIVSLLRHGANFHASDLTLHGAVSPLNIIVMFRDARFLATVLERCNHADLEVDVNTRNERGYTALHYANSIEKAAILMKYGANERILNNDGEPAWMTHKSERVQEGIKIIRQLITLTSPIRVRRLHYGTYLPVEHIRMLHDRLRAIYEAEANDDAETVALGE